MRVETIRMSGGEGHLELCNSEGETALLVDGLPAALVWTNAGDQGPCTVLRAHDTAHLEEDGIDAGPPVRTILPEVSLMEQVEPLLALYADGLYEVAYEDHVEMFDEDDPQEPQAPEPFLNWVGLKSMEADGGLLLGTRPRDLLDPAMVDSLHRRLQLGIRPPVVITRALHSPVAFILDGHHLMEAYQRLGQPVPVLTITSLQPRQLSPEEGCELIRLAYAQIADITAAHYRASRLAHQRRHAVGQAH